MLCNEVYHHTNTKNSFPMTQTELPLKQRELRKLHTVHLRTYLVLISCCINNKKRGKALLTTIKIRKNYLTGNSCCYLFFFFTAPVVSYMMLHEVKNFLSVEESPATALPHPFLLATVSKTAVTSIRRSPSKEENSFV